MGFDLNATTHTFTKTTDGGAEQVVANDPADQANIGSLRSHLQTGGQPVRRGQLHLASRDSQRRHARLAESWAGAARVQVG
ncbi:MAG: hypothetical protein ACXVGN_02050 [Mycobacteriaceae bacterium]